MTKKRLLLFYFIASINLFFSCNGESRREEKLGETKIVTITNDNPNIEMVSYYDKQEKLYMVEKKIIDKNIRYFKSFYDTGRKKAQYTIVDSEITGYFYVFYDNTANTIKSKTNFNQSEENGLEIQYYESGKIFKKSSYQNGKLKDSIYEFADDNLNSLKCKHPA